MYEQQSSFRFRMLRVVELPFLVLSLVPIGREDPHLTEALINPNAFP